MFQVISACHLVQAWPGSSLSSSSDTTRNRFVYTNLVLNILWKILTVKKYHDGSSTNFLLTTRQAFPYTVLLVDTCTRSWKTIEFILVSALDSARSLAWYSRTLRMRRGPNSNLCTLEEIWKAPLSIWASIDCEFYRNGEQWLQADVNNRSMHEEPRRENNKLNARYTSKASMCAISAENIATSTLQAHLMK